MEEGKEYENKIRETADPVVAHSIGREFQKTYKNDAFWKDWNDNIKFKIMEKGVKSKFFQNQGLMNRLLMTGSAFLVEANDRDLIWYSLFI